MKIEILSSTIALNRVCHVGEQIDICDKDGLFLIRLGKAVELFDAEVEFTADEIISDEVRVRRRVRKP